MNCLNCKSHTLRRKQTIVVCKDKSHLIPRKFNLKCCIYFMYTSKKYNWSVWKRMFNKPVFQPKA